MAVDGRRYTKDLMLLAGGTVVHPWRRAEGHRLALSDLGAVLDFAPDVLVVGTGSPGMMKVDAALAAELSARGIRTVALPTAQAVLEYNRLARAGAKVAACFHLTC